MDSPTTRSAENTQQGTAHSVPKPAAPIDVAALLHRLETKRSLEMQSLNVQAADVQTREQQAGNSQSAEKQAEETRVRGTHIQDEQIDEQIAQLESIHAQLTRDLNRARA